MKIKKLLIVLSLLIASYPSFADTFDTMRIRWYNFLTANTGIPTTATSAQSHWGSMNKSSTRSYLWSDCNFTESRDITTSYMRLNVMAKALKTPNSSLYNNTTLKADIISALRWMDTYQYNDHLPASKMPDPNDVSIRNWWDYQIGSPLELNDIVVLLHSDLTTTDIDNFMDAVGYFAHDFSQCWASPSLGCAGTFTGANRVWISNVIALKGVIRKNADTVQYASNSLSPVFLYAAPGKDGFHRDGSFIQHQTFAYTGGYGMSLLSTIGRELYILGGTSFYPTDPNLANVYNWVHSSYAPIIFKGGLMSNTQGREIARPECDEQDKARQAAEAVALLASMAPSTYQPKLKGLVKQWVSEGNDARKSPPAYQQLIDAIINDPAIVPNNDLKYAYRQFANMGRVVQRYNNYAFAVSMYSKSLQNYEGGTTENKKGWHTGDGMTYLYTTDTSQFVSNYWPTVNAYRLPGTTVASTTEVGGYKTNSETKRFSGGAALLDRFGVTGFDFDPAGQNQSAKKSYFMFDGKIVCLGAAVVTSGTVQVDTYIENRKLSNDNSNAFVVDGVTQPTSITAIKVIPDAKWAHIQFPNAWDDIGYYFPTPLDLNILRKSYTGSWNDLHDERSTTPYTKNYLMFWKNHGVNATNTGSDANRYDYVLLPGYTKAETEAFAASPTISILSNTSVVQAAKDISSKMIGANFWPGTGGALTVGGVASYITSNKPCSIIMKQSNDTLFVAVSDPTHDADNIAITIKETAISTISKDSQISVAGLNTISFTANATDMVGKSMNVKFKLGAGVVLNNAPSEGKLMLNESGTEEAGGMTVSASPNPSTDYINLSISNVKSGSMDIELLTLSGGGVKKFKHMSEGEKTSFTIPAGELNAGVYLVSLKQAGHVVTTKVIINK